MADKRSAIQLIDDYLTKLEPDKRAALEHIRALVKKAAPAAEEAMVYGVPGFKQDGALVCYAAHAAHCGFDPMSPDVIEALAADLAGFETAKGTIRFTPDHPIPDALVTEIVQRRLDENAAKAAHDKRKKRLPK